MGNIYKNENNLQRPNTNNPNYNQHNFNNGPRGGPQMYNTGYNQHQMQNAQGRHMDNHKKYRKFSLWGSSMAKFMGNEKDDVRHGEHSESIRNDEQVKNITQINVDLNPRKITMMNENIPRKNYVHKNKS